MLVSYNWIKKFVKTKKSAEEIADKITLSLAEVDSIQKLGDDYILEVENKGLTHRPDCFSHLGIAREVSAYFNILFDNPLTSLAKEDIKPEKQLPLDIQIKAENLCFRYSGLVLSDIKVKPSPNWLKTALERIGENSINNVVDITNYVMFELGQPLHAFDYDKVKDHKIIVRKAKKGEKLITLDGEQRNLTEDMLIIADSKKPIALAGIKGGQETGIDKNTNTIILEAANFEYKNNRQTTKKLSLRTEASTRFEKNLDITLTIPAIKQTAKLLQKYAGAKIASKIIDKQTKKFKQKIIKVEKDWINRFIGFNLSAKKMQKILESLGFETTLENNLLKSKVPSWRQDINMKADIAEEIARINGYDKIPITLPRAETKPPKRNPVFFWRRKAKQTLAELGYTEVYTQPFVGADLLNKTGMDKKKHLKLVNPLTIDQEYMRISLVPSLVASAKDNLTNYSNFKIFEIDKIFIPRGNKQPDEIPYLTGIAVGERYRKIKGDLEVFLEKLGITNYTFMPLSENKINYSRFMQPEQTAQIRVGNKFLGICGFPKREILSNIKIDINTNLIIFDINFSYIKDLASEKKQYTPIPQYPPLIEDMTFAFPERTYIGQVIKKIKNQSNLIKKVDIWDIYKNNYTFRITYQSQKKSLSSSYIQNSRKKIASSLKNSFKAKLIARE